MPCTGSKTKLISHALSRKAKHSLFTHVRLNSHSAMHARRCLVILPCTCARPQSIHHALAIPRGHAYQARISPSPSPSIPSPPLSSLSLPLFLFPFALIPSFLPSFLLSLFPFSSYTSSLFLLILLSLSSPLHLPNFPLFCFPLSLFSFSFPLLLRFLSPSPYSLFSPSTSPALPLSPPPALAPSQALVHAWHRGVSCANDSKNCYYSFQIMWQLFCFCVDCLRCVAV